MSIDATAERLVQYAAQGDATTVELLLVAGVSVNAHDSLRHVSPLHNAAAMGHSKLVAHFLDLGASVDTPDWRGVTPLVNAAYYGRDAIVALLLEHHAKVDVRPAHAPTPLIAAIESGSLPVIDRLLAAGANPALADFSDTTPLQAAQRMKRADIAEYLQHALDKGKP